MLGFLRKPYRTLNTIEVSASALIHNLNAYRKRVPQQAVCPVLKSNAYGHGLIEVGKVMEKESPPFLIVDSLYEAQKLKKSGIKSPILILGYTLPENLRSKRYPFHFTVTDLPTAHILAKHQTPVHIEVDTGMARTGFNMEEFPQALQAMKAMRLNVEGLFTHLADADNPESLQSTQSQLQSFQKAIQWTRAAGFRPKWIHANNSAGASVASLPDLNMMRLGIGLYGFPQVFDKELEALQIAISIKSTLIAVRQLKKGQKISYNGTFTAPKTMHIGTLPFGYYEGLPRTLSNQAPFLGRICMNHSMIQVKPTAKPGDEVEIYKDIVKSSAKSGTISYELLARLSESVRREVR